MINLEHMGRSIIGITLIILTGSNSVIASESARYTDRKSEDRNHLASGKIDSGKRQTKDNQKSNHNKISVVSVKIIGAVEGSGVIIKSKSDTYTVLTAWHAIKDTSTKEDLNIITYDNKSHSAKQSSKQRIGESDMATIEFRSQSKYEEARTVDINYERNLPVIISGYPSQEKILKQSNGLIVLSSVKYIEKGYINIFMDQGYQLVYSNTTQKGMSGGGIFTKQGELIGIHGRGELDRPATLRKQTYTKSGVSYGMPINLFLDQSKATAARLNRVTITNADALTLDIVLRTVTTMVKGEEQLMITFADEILKIKETFPAYYLKHRALFSLPDHQANLEVLNKMLELKELTTTERRLALVGRAGVLSVLNQVEDALEDHKELLLIAETNDQKASILRTIGNLLERKGRQKEATAYYAKVESLLDKGKLSDLESFNTYQSAALTAYSDGKHKEAQKYIFKALKYNIPERNSKRLRLFLASNIYARDGRYDKAIKIIDEYLQKDGLDIDALKARGDIYVHRREDVLLEQNAQQILHFMPRNPFALFHMSMVHIFRKDINKACYYFNKMVEEEGSAGFHDQSPLHKECKNLENFE